MAEAAWDAKMRKLTMSVLKKGKLKTPRRKDGERRRKRDKLFHREWADNEVFIDNQKFIVQPGDKTQRIEIMLEDIIHVSHADEPNDFELSWGCEHGSTVLVQAVSSEKNNRQDEVEEFSMGNLDDGFNFEMPRTDDHRLVFRGADRDDAQSWMNAINRAIQVTKSTDATSSASLLREYSTIGGDVNKWGGKGRKKKANLEVKLKKATHKISTIFPPRVQAIGRSVGTVLSTISTIMIGGFLQSLLIAAVAPPAQRRDFRAWLQNIWLDAITWMTPNIEFHVYGDNLVSTRGIRSSNKRNSKRNSSQAEINILVANSLSECDVLYSMMLAEAVESKGGCLKALVPQQERRMFLGLGKVLDLFGFVFIDRSNKADVDEINFRRIQKHVARLVQEKGSEWLIIFPEHGYPTPRTKLKQGAGFENILGPHPEELEACLETLKNRQVNVYDLTFAYKGYDGHFVNEAAPSYSTCMNGQAATDIFLFSKRYSCEEVLDMGLEKWLGERWNEKDEMLTHFATHGVFPVDPERERVDVFAAKGQIVNMLALWIFNCIFITFLAKYLPNPFLFI